MELNMKDKVDILQQEVEATMTVKDLLILTAAIANTSEADCTYYINEEFGSNFCVGSAECVVSDYNLELYQKMKTFLHNVL